MTAQKITLKPKINSVPNVTINVKNVKTPLPTVPSVHLNLTESEKNVNVKKDSMMTVLPSVKNVETLVLSVKTLKVVLNVKNQELVTIVPAQIPTTKRTVNV